MIQKGSIVYYALIWPNVFTVKDISGGYAILCGQYNTLAVRIDRLIDYNIKV